MCDTHSDTDGEAVGSETGDEDEPERGFQITQRSLDGGRPRGQLTFDGAVAPDVDDDDGGEN
ncbi:hypothetical protein [Halalkalicoccus jeotgali]|uniref:Uncharacterized protein n=1 Tax=Halalkalicoccus jeotgali (strain DSM 18796 / CECT 7217 / JCM 14584 / KCTC 4019 / B3) TaxID=795797 RepID=D8J9M1_HALJB|nr:hypothetical protein [Halalkalicoccus jeotgali]ADJ14433.1 hypothetical protein HacjB3_05210 [Halalkalicoccus jeotgali B3]ELY40149.1 hypothetical protein C497_03595 [Halalkalicoccus jeotgali B3]